MSVLYLLLSSLWLGIWAWAKEHTSRIHVALGLVCVLTCLSNILNAIDLSMFKSSSRPSQFIFTLGSLMFIFYCLFVNVIFTAAGTGLHVIRYLVRFDSTEWKIGACRCYKQRFGIEQTHFD